uniref:Uncharacterized protein n=1 Tax=Cannabis sativa TaxID=3483 RepID=A0A803QDW2_CANSA
MQAMVSTPFDLSSADFSTNSERCFCEPVRVKAPEQRRVWLSCPCLSPTEIVAKIFEVDLAVEKRSGFGRWWLLRAKEVKERREESSVLDGKREAVAVVERQKVVDGAVENVVVRVDCVISDDDSSSSASSSDKSRGPFSNMSSDSF